MFENIEVWIRRSIKCCACGGTLETSRYINVVGLKKLATWKFPVIGHIDIPGYKPRATAIICDECVQNNEEVRFCIEWQESLYKEPHRVTYHDVDTLEDIDKSEELMKCYFGRKFRRGMLIKAMLRLNKN